MPLFSFKRSSTQQSAPLYDGGYDEGETETRSGVRRGRSFLGKFRKNKNRSKRYSPPPTSRETSSSPFVSWRYGMTFCGCCDMRIATSFLNVLHMVVALAGEIIDASRQWNKNYLQEPPLLLFMVIGVSSLGLLGALHFSRYLLHFSSLCMSILVYLYLIEAHILGLFMVPTVLFAQCVLADEIRRGVMSEDTYLMEEYIDEDGRKVIQTVQQLSGDVKETAAEFAEEVVIEIKRVSSGASQMTKGSQVSTC